MANTCHVLFFLSRDSHELLCTFLLPASISSFKIFLLQDSYPLPCRILFLDSTSFFKTFLFREKHHLSCPNLFPVPILFLIIVLFRDSHQLPCTIFVPASISSFIIIHFWINISCYGLFTIDLSFHFSKLSTFLKWSNSICYFTNLDFIFENSTLPGYASIAILPFQLPFLFLSFLFLDSHQFPCLTIDPASISFFQIPSFVIAIICYALLSFL